MLAALVLAVLTNALDATIVNVALPTIATKLSVGTGVLQWVLNSYLLVFAGLMLPAGALGDRHGRKWLLLGGLLSHGYAGRIVTSGLPAGASGIARGSIAGALAVAGRFGDPVLAASARAAFVHGMAVALSTWAAVAVLGAALIAAFLPGRPRRDTRPERRYEQGGHDE